MPETFTGAEILLVICQGELSAALRTLEGQKAVHTMWYIHILETDQPSWLVYSVLDSLP